MATADWLACVAVLAAPAALAVCSIADDSSLTWFADPLRWPQLHLAPALALLPLLVPVVLRERTRG